MGHEASFQAIPEDCALLKRARYDVDIADQIQSFHWVAQGHPYPRYGPRVEPEAFFIASAQALVKENPGIIDRYFYPEGRKFDMIIYLLSPERRQLNFAELGNSRIYQVYHGTELLHPEARAGQGRPIGFVPASNVHIVANYLASISFDQLHEQYDPQAMWDAGVYKIHPTDGEETFRWIWEELQGAVNVYKAASEHNEAIIAVID